MRVRRHVNRVRRLLPRTRLSRRGAVPSTDALIDEIAVLAERDDRQGLARLFERTPELDQRDQERVYRRFYRAFLALGDDERAVAALTRAAGPHNRTAHHVWDDLATAEFGPARERFARDLELIVHEAGRDDWLACFDMLHGDRRSIADDSGGPSTPEPIERFERTVATQWRFLSVSGMGWSGSGAVYDALRSHRGARSVAGESRLLEGKYGLSGLRGDTSDDAVFHGALQNLFRYCLIGYAPCRTWEEYRHVRNARRAAMGPRGDELARFSRDALRSLLNCPADERAALVTQLSPEFLEAATLAQIGHTSKVPVLDNVVHIGNLEIATAYPDVLFFAVVRDPRDQFLDIVRNNPRSPGDPALFIKRYRRSRARLKKNIETGGSSIRVVSFERFVRDDEAREEAIGDVVADLGTLRARPKFDPEVSRQNIGLWRDTDRVDAIRTIEAALPEYLVD